MSEEDQEVVVWPNRDCDLYSFLASTTDGKSILRAYEDNRALTNNARNLLTRLVIKSEKDAAFEEIDVVDGERKMLESFSISTERFEDLSSQIVQLFPGESKETYYTKCRTVARVSIPQAGKLWDHYCYTKKVLREQNLLLPSMHKQHTQACLSGPAFEIVDNDEKIGQLGSGLATTAQTLTLWEETFDLRRTLLDNKISISDYYKKFPCLALEIGKELIGIDFEKRHPAKQSILFDRWDRVRAQLITQLQLCNIKDVSDRALIQLLPTLAPDRQDAIIVYLLPHLAQGTCVLQPSKRRKRTIADTENETPRLKWTFIERRRGFLLHVQNATDISSELEALEETLRAIGLTRQPLPVFVGPIAAIQASYVSIDRVLYKVLSPVHALDLCFKLFVSLDCAYPVQASSMWVFLQRAVYEITYPTDVTNRSVNVLIGSIKTVVTAP